MQLNRNSKIELAASKDSSRQHLAHPYLDVEARVLVATDGVRLVKHPVEVHRADVSGYISSDALKAARKLARRSPEIVIRAGAKTLELLDGTTMPRPTSEHSFPPYDRVIPDYSGQTTVTVGLDAKLLFELCQAMGGNANDGTAVMLTFPIPHTADAKMKDAILVKRSDVDVVGILMPWNDR